MTERGPGPFVRRSSRTLWLEACLSLLLPGAFLPCSSAGQSCGIGCHCLSRKQQGGALISSGSTAQPPSCVERISMRPPPRSCCPCCHSPSSKLGSREPLGPGKGSSFCSFGNSALQASTDPLLSHLRSDARKVGEMQDSVGETPGVTGSTPIWNPLRGSTQVGQLEMKMSTRLLVKARLEKCGLGSICRHIGLASTSPPQ